MSPKVFTNALIATPKAFASWRKIERAVDGKRKTEPSSYGFCIVKAARLESARFQGILSWMRGGLVHTCMATAGTGCSRLTPPLPRARYSRHPNPNSKWVSTTGGLCLYVRYRRTTGQYTGNLTIRHVRRNIKTDSFTPSRIMNLPLESVDKVFLECLIVAKSQIT